MRFFYDSRVSTVLKSSCIIHTLRFSVRGFLALIAMEGMYAGIASLHGCNLLEQCRSNCRGAKACRRKITIFETPLKLIYQLLTGFCRHLYTGVNRLPYQRELTTLRVSAHVMPGREFAAFPVPTCYSPCDGV